MLALSTDLIVTEDSGQRLVVPSHQQGSPVGPMFLLGLRREDRMNNTTEMTTGAENQMLFNTGVPFSEETGIQAQSCLHILPGGLCPEKWPKLLPGRALEFCFDLML